jgi:hypothetical protein
MELQSVRLQCDMFRICNYALERIKLAFDSEIFMDS